MEAPSLDLLSRLEGECEQASLLVNAACDRCAADPGPRSERTLSSACAHFLNQCERLCFLLVRSPEHLQYRSRYFNDLMHFIECWPEYAENPDGFPSLGELVALWSTSAESGGEHEPPRVSQPSRRQAVQDLLQELFDAAELRQWVAGDDALSLIGKSLPEAPAPITVIVSALVGAAERHGHLDDAFFDALTRVRPRRSKAIAEVRRRFIAPSVSHDEHRRGDGRTQFLREA